MALRVGRGHAAPGEPLPPWAGSGVGRVGIYSLVADVLVSPAEQARASCRCSWNGGRQAHGGTAGHADRLPVPARRLRTGRVADLISLTLLCSAFPNVREALPAISGITKVSLSLRSENKAEAAFLGLGSCY